MHSVSAMSMFGLRRRSAVWNVAIGNLESFPVQIQLLCVSGIKMQDPWDLHLAQVATHTCLSGLFDGYVEIQLE